MVPHRVPISNLGTETYACRSIGIRRSLGLTKNYWDVYFLCIFNPLDVTPYIEARGEKSNRRFLRLFATDNHALNYKKKWVWTRTWEVNWSHSSKIWLRNNPGPGIQAQFHLADFPIHFLHEPVSSPLIEQLNAPDRDSLNNEINDFML